MAPSISFAPRSTCGAIGNYRRVGPLDPIGRAAYGRTIIGTVNTRLAKARRRTSTGVQPQEE
jgi:hypothetical protein